MASEDDWAPAPNSAMDVTRLALTMEEGFVLSRLDGATSLNRLPILTGFAPPELQDILTRLVACGAVLPPARSTASPPPSAAETPEIRASPAVARAPEHPVETLEGPDAEGTNPEASEEPSADEASDGQSELTFRALFEQQLHALEADQRTAMAHIAAEPELSALCFDPLPAVVKAVLQNPKAGLAQARLIARHHRNPVGLEAVAERSAFLADQGVRRWLTRNPQLASSLARRLYTGRRLLEQYKVSQDRDVPEGTRRTLRELMRSRFSSAAAEERVELILTTDGRALNALSGLPVDGKTTSMLCARPYSSTLFIQNVARWSAAPPPLIAHLLRMETVRRQPNLRQMLKRHPNAPSTP